MIATTETEERRSLVDWIEGTTIEVAMATAVGGLVGLSAALLGVYHVAFAVVGLSLVLVAALRGVRRLAYVSVSSGERVVVAGLSVVVIGCLAVYLAATSQNVLVLRDPAVYSNTAEWLSSEGTLFVDADEGPFAGHPDLRFGTAGLYELEGDGNLEFQFTHLPATYLSMANDLAGSRALFRIPALFAAVSLIGVFGVARRLTGSSLAAVGSAATFGITLPFVSVARETYSEAFAVFFLWIGILALSRAWERWSPSGGAAAGLLLGTTIAARVDSIAYLLVILATLFVLVAHADLGALAGARRTAAATLAGMVPGSVLGFVDVETAAGRYADDLPSGLDIARTGSALAGVVLVAILVWPNGLRSVWNRLHAARRAIATVLAAGAVVALALGWFVRPNVAEVRQEENNLFLEVIQEAQGLPPDGTLLYAEDSVRWLSWYLGQPGLVLAIIGVGLIVHRLGSSVLSPSLVAVGGLLATQATYYLWNPSITPDHIWAMRRFVPVVLPIFITAAWLTIALIGRELRRRRPDGDITAPVAAVSLALLTILPVAASLWPVREFRTQFQALGVVESVCNEIGPDAAVVFVDPEPAVPAVRGWCDVPVAVARPDLDRAELAELAEAWREEGQVMWVMARAPAVITNRFDDVGVIERSAIGENTRRLERTLDQRPDDYTTGRFEIFFARVE